MNKFDIGDIVIGDKIYKIIDADKYTQPIPIYLIKHGNEQRWDFCLGWKKIKGSK